MIGGHDPITSSGWGRVSQGRAWTSGSASGLLENSDPEARVAAGVLLRLQRSPAFVRLTPSLRKEWNALTKEKDPELLFAGLMAWAGRLESAGKLEIASEVYSAIVQGTPHPRPLPQGERGKIPSPLEGEGARRAGEGAIHLRAQRRLDTLVGRGSFGSRAEVLLRDFSSQVTHPASLAALVAGSLTFGFTRHLVLQKIWNSPLKGILGSAVATRFAASSVAFLAEVPAFTLTGLGVGRALGQPVALDSDSVVRQMISGGLVLGSMRGVGAIVHGAPRYLGLKPQAYGWVHQAGLLGGILLGHRLEVAAGLRPATDSSQTLTDSLAMLVQFQAAGHLTRGLLGKNLGRWERRWQEPANSQSDFLKNIFPGERLATASVASPSHTPLPPSRETDLSKNLPISLMSKAGDGGSAEARSLKEHFLPSFPPSAEGFHSEEIIDLALRIPLEIPVFHQRLLEGLAADSQAGRLDQFYRVQALDDLFRTNSLNSSTGSWDFTLLQLLVGQILADDAAPRRKAALQALFRAMDSSWQDTSVEGLLEKYSYGNQLKLPSDPIYSLPFYNRHVRMTNYWQGYRRDDQILLLNFIFLKAHNYPGRASRMIRAFAEGRNSGIYPIEWIDAALDYARTHPQGALVVQRLLHIFAVVDLPGKLLEFRPTTEKIDTLEEISQMLQGRMTIERIAREINGTYHTAYLDDIRVARKIAYVLREMLPFLQNPSKRDGEKAKLKTAIYEFLDSGKTFSPHALLNLAKANQNPQVDSLVQSWLLGKFSVELASPEKAARWDRVDGTDLARYRPSNVQGETPRILIRPLPTVDLSDPAGKYRAYQEIALRLNGLIHEWEHWRHTTGNYEGVERPAPPVLYYSGNIQDYLVSEVMAYLEDNLWRMRVLEEGYLRVARKLGVNLPLYWRNHADRSKFRTTNQQRIAELVEAP